MEGVSLWLKNNHLTLKTVSMCFSMRRKATEKFIIRINQEEIEEVNDFKFLGVILDPKLKFAKHVKQCKTVKTNLNCFRMIRQYIPLKAAQLYACHDILPSSLLCYCMEPGFTVNF